MLLVAAITLVLILTGCHAPVGNSLEQAAFPPQPERRFIRVGATDGGRQFTDEEFQFLARNYDYVLFEKFHGGWNIELQHEAARRLVELNPAVHVYPYFSTKYWFPQNRWDGRPFDPAWYLRDNAGNIIYRSRARDQRTANSDPDNSGRVAFVDLANPDYRAWALATLRSWMTAAPYDGISFDSAEPIGDYGEKDVAQWDRLLGQDRIQQYNAGMRSLLEDAKRLVGTQRDIIYNGFAPSAPRGPDRNLDLLAIADGALDERFCLDHRGDVHALQDDLDLMGRYEDRKLFLHTNYPEEKLGKNERERYGRFCLGNFLMGWRPGLTYFRFGDNYTADQLHHDFSDINVPLGSPTGTYQRSAGILSRSFANGEVYVNTSARSAQVTLPRASTRAEDGGAGPLLAAGSLLTIPPQDAVFLLMPAAH